MKPQQPFLFFFWPLIAVCHAGKARPITDVTIWTYFSFPSHSFFFFFQLCRSSKKKKGEKRWRASVCKVCREKPRCSSTPLLFFPSTDVPICGADSVGVSEGGTNCGGSRRDDKTFDGFFLKILRQQKQGNTTNAYFLVLFFCIVNINDDSLGKRVLNTTLCKHHI